MAPNALLTAALHAAEGEVPAGINTVMAIVTRPVEGMNGDADATTDSDAEADPEADGVLVTAAVREGDCDIDIDREGVTDAATVDDMDVVAVTLGDTLGERDGETHDIMPPSPQTYVTDSGSVGMKKDGDKPVATPRAIVTEVKPEVDMVAAMTAGKLEVLGTKTVARYVA